MSFRSTKLRVDTSEVANGTVFSLGSAPQILKAKVSQGTLLATVSEKGYGTPRTLNGTLLRIALDLSKTVGTPPGPPFP